ncbi:uracil-DNA glycosylase, partial [Nitratireductor sp. GCM10026969]
MMPDELLDPARLRALLAFYADAGVDTALEEEPQNRFAEGPPAKPEPPSAAAEARAPSRESAPSRPRPA